MACFCHPLPLLPCFLLSDGKIFTGRAICKLTYLYPMANISPFVPSLPCVSSFDGKHSADRAIATAHFHELSDEIKSCEARLKEIGNLKKAIINYSKTRSTYEAYRKAGYSRKFYEAHRVDITIHRAAKKVFDSLPDKKIPKVRELTEEYSKVLEKKKAAYQEYRVARKEMEQYTVAQKNLDMLLGRESVLERNVQPSREM